MLTLPIMGKWFNMILSGEKGEEKGKEYYTLKIHQITERSGC